MMTNLDDIRAHWAEYNTGAHQVDWYIDRGLGLASDVGTLLEMLERQQDVIDAAIEYRDHGGPALGKLFAALAALDAQP